MGCRWSAVTIDLGLCAHVEFHVQALHKLLHASLDNSSFTKASSVYIGSDISWIPTATKHTIINIVCSGSTDNNTTLVRLHVHIYVYIYVCAICISTYILKGARLLGAENPKPLNRYLEARGT